MIAIPITGCFILYLCIAVANEVYWNARKTGRYRDGREMVFGLSGWFWPLAPLWLPILLCAVAAHRRGELKKSNHVGWFKSRRDKKQEARLNREKRIAQLEKELGL